ncbi:MAG: 30S ribosome-binding factor RbfA [Flavobacteriales bacterium]|jgi:ribosome-binding factor A|tara:strand:+ start:2637 stop:3029 length:393 start_codon:yes stop_codon:yes gene_type:complete
METTRQKKISGILQKDLIAILQRLLKDSMKNTLIASVTKVKISPDLSVAKVYVSVFPVKASKEVFELIKESRGAIRNSLGVLVKNQIRRVPELSFFLDDSLDYIEKIDSALKNGEDPIKNTDLLEKRKKL